MGNYVIGALLAVIVFFAVRSMIKRGKSGLLRRRRVLRSKSRSERRQSSALSVQGCTECGRYAL